MYSLPSGTMAKDLYAAFLKCVASGEVVAVRLAEEFTTPAGELMTNYLVLDNEQFRRLWDGLTGPLSGGPSKMALAVLAGRKLKGPSRLPTERFFYLADLTRKSMGRDGAFGAAPDACLSA